MKQKVSKADRPLVQHWLMSRKRLAYKDTIRGWPLGRIKAALDVALQTMCDASYRVDRTQFDDGNWRHDALVDELIRRAAGKR